MSKTYVIKLDDLNNEKGSVIFSGTEKAALKFANDFAQKNAMTFKSNTSIYGGRYVGDIDGIEGVCVALNHEPVYPL